MVSDYWAVGLVLDEGIAAVRALSEADQNDAGKILLELAQQRKEPFQFTPEQEAEIHAALAEMRRGEFATDEQVVAFWKSAGV